MEFEEFRTKIARLGKNKNFKVRNSFTIYQIYKKIRKGHWYDIGRPVTEHEFYTIIRSVNKLFAQALENGESITFPHKMGSVELAKFERKVEIKDGVLHIGYPVDWNKTLRVWYEDEEARKNKILIRDEHKYSYVIRYRKPNSAFQNCIFYKFAMHYKLKNRILTKAKNGEIDTLW